MIAVAEKGKIFKRLYTFKDAAVYLSRSEWTIAKMVRDGELPFVRHGGRKLLDIHDLDRWIEGNKETDIV